MTTADFVALFSEEGANSFAEDPPNADFTCESGEALVNQVVTLTDPVFDPDADTLTYTAALVPTVGCEGYCEEIFTCDVGAHLFIDSKRRRAGRGKSTWAHAVTPAGCKAGGGTWDAETITCTAASNYNCFIGGFCSRVADRYSPDKEDYEYTNLYTNHRPDRGDALAAGCNEGEGQNGGKLAWARGRKAAEHPSVDNNGCVASINEGEDQSSGKLAWARGRKSSEDPSVDSNGCVKVDCVIDWQPWCARR